MNTTNITEVEDDTVVILSANAKVVTLCLTSLFLLGILPNLLLIWTFATTHGLQNHHNALVMNLVTADLLIIGYMVPCNMAATALGYYPFPDIVCTINGILLYVCCTASIDSFVAIALNRYVKICRSQYYQKIFTNKTTFAMVAGSWILGGILVIPYVIEENGIIYDKTIQMCAFNRFIKGAYPIVSMVISILIPISITCLCYLGIYRHFRKVRVQPIQDRRNDTSKTRLSQNMVVARSCFVVFITSLIAFTPFGMSSILFNEPTQLPLPVHLFIGNLALSNSAANCIIYVLMNRNIREAYKRKLPCIFRNNAIHSNEIIPETSAGQNPTTNSAHGVKMKGQNSSHGSTI